MMTRFWLFLFIVFINRQSICRAQNSNWEIPIAVKAEEDINASSATVIIGARSDATDMHDGALLEPISPAGPFDGATIRSTHSTSEIGYGHLSNLGGQVDLSRDYRAIFYPDQDKIWRLKIGYFGLLPQATLRLSWPSLQSLPTYITMRIGRETDFVDNPGGGLDMRTQTQFRLPISAGTQNFVELRVRNLAGQPLITLSPKSADVSVGDRLPITASVQNAVSLEWTVNPAAALLKIAETRSEFIAPNIPGIYTVRATIRDARGQTATDTATINVHAVPILYGDLDLNGKIEMNDIHEAYQLFLGFKTSSVGQLLAGDVRPKPGLSGRLVGDGMILADDLNWIQRRLLGLEVNNP
jgi:hypothetical protein